MEFKNKNCERCNSCYMCIIDIDMKCSKCTSIKQFNIYKIVQIILILVFLILIFIEKYFFAWMMCCIQFVIFYYLFLIINIRKSLMDNEGHGSNWVACKCGEFGPHSNDEHEIGMLHRS